VLISPLPHRPFTQKRKTQKREAFAGAVFEQKRRRVVAGVCV